MGFKRIYISSEMLADLLCCRLDFTNAVSNCPADIRVVQVWPDHEHFWPNNFWLTVESEEFEAISEGAAIPIMVPKFTKKSGKGE